MHAEAHVHRNDEACWIGVRVHGTLTWSDVLYHSQLIVNLSHRQLTPQEEEHSCLDYPMQLPPNALLF